MKTALDLRFLGLAPSDAIEAAVHARVAHIERVCPDIMAWRITIEQEHKHQHQGRPFSVRMDITIPGQELAVTRAHDEDCYVALRDAFDAAQRKLEETVRQRREAQRHS
jgi:ribosomal subunit interface protein